MSLRMLAKMVLPILFSTLVVAYAHAAETEMFSLKPFQKCKMPPTSPPAKLLDKAYKIYMGVGDWQRADINGDGWCDWVRDGYEGYRTDQETPSLREFIYLGTPKGWREFGQSEVYKAAQKTKRRAAVIGLFPPSTVAFNFYQPLVIYSNKINVPYVVVVSRPDAPAPFPEVNDIYVARWDDTFDMLREVNEKDRQKIIEFMRIEMCKIPQVHLKNGGPYIVMEELCKTK